jgi:hypothetical protein
MSRRRYTPEQIIGKLREAEVALVQGGGRGAFGLLCPLTTSFACTTPQFFLGGRDQVDVHLGTTFFAWLGDYRFSRLPPYQFCLLSHSI